MRSQRCTVSVNGFSIFELIMALGFIMLFSAAILDTFYQSIHGNYAITLMHQNRTALEALNQELSVNCHRSIDLAWNQDDATLRFMQSEKPVFYRVIEHKLMKNTGNGWYPVPGALHIEAFAPGIMQNRNGKLLVLAVDFKNEGEPLHARAGYSTKYHSSF